MSHDHDHKLSRRGFLGTSAIIGMQTTGMLPVAALFEAITMGFVRQAYAETLKLGDPRNYINVMMIGAPARYTFDHWVRPTPGEPFATNPLVATRLRETNGIYTDTDYITFNHRGVEIPHMFSQSVNTSAGATPLTQLADNMLVIRGYGTGVDGHPANAAVQVRPIGGAPSISGLVADHSNVPFSAVQYSNRGDFSTFVSNVGKGISLTDDGRPAHALMQGFSQPSGMNARNLKNKYAGLLDGYRSRLGMMSSGNDKASRILASNANNATALMRKGLAALDGFWDPAVNRYRNIIFSALRTLNLPGISDRAIMNPNGNFDKFRTFIHFYGDGAPTTASLANDFDVRNSITDAVVNAYAEGLAMSEFLIREKLGNVMEIRMHDLGNVRGKLMVNGTAREGMGNSAHDMHEVGAVSAVLWTTGIFRAYAAGILELAHQLKQVAAPGGSNLWKETVVQLSSDFGRSARSDGSGSDHGFDQMVTSVISGAIDQPMVVGNIRSDKQAYNNPGYGGTQGYRAPIDGYNGGVAPTPVTAAATVAEVLRVEHNPYSNSAPALVKNQSGRVVYSEFGKGKNV